MTDRTESELQEFAERYVAVWNEPDPQRRRDQIRALWAPSGSNRTPSLEATGYDELETRIASSYEKWVAGQGYRFRSRGRASGHHGTVRLNWEMVPSGGSKPASVGFDFCVLDEDGRIQDDYQFIDV